MAAPDAVSAQPSRMTLFLRASVFDYVLVLIVSCALTFTVSYGFYSAPDLRGNVALIAAASAVLLAVLYFGGWSKRAVAISAAVYAVLAAGVVAFIASLSPEAVDLFVDGQINDVENNFAVFGIVVVVVPPIVYLLSRRSWGMVALFFLGTLACGAIQFLYRDWISSEPGTIAALVAYVGMGALFVMQGYRHGVLTSRIVKKTSFLAAFTFGVVGASACVGVGALMFYGIISGLGLGTVDAKPFEDYYTRPVIEYDGDFEQELVYDPELGTSNLSDEIDYTNDDENGVEGEQDAQSSGGFSFVSSVIDTLNMDEWQETFEAIRFDIPLPMRVLLWLLPPLIVALAVYLRYRRREQRLRAIERRPIPERVVLLYNFFMRGLKCLKVEKPPSATPLEFALSTAGELAGFARNESHADLLGITLIYQRAVYGAGNVSYEDYRYVRDYYESFFENAHARMGHLGWALKGFWRI